MTDNPHIIYGGPMPSEDKRQASRRESARELRAKLDRIVAYAREELAAARSSPLRNYVSAVNTNRNNGAHPNPRRGESGHGNDRRRTQRRINGN